MKYLALDPGASFGWAMSGTVGVDVDDVGLAAFWHDNHVCRVRGTPCICGAWNLGIEKDYGTRYSLLIQLIESQKDCDLSIYYEVAPGLKGQASVWHLGYLATVQAVASRIGAGFIKVNASTWKRLVLHNARASKNDIRAYAQKAYHIDPGAPQDALDALCILEHALTLNG
jgi:hypothetical protein